MKLIQEGKTKTVFQREDGNIILRFKDDVTGEAGKIDPGANSVIGKVEGKGNASLRLSRHFFELLEREGIPTHYIDADLHKNTLLVRKALLFGDGLEFICRHKAAGSFVRRYGRYIKEGALLNYLVEITLKDDERGDPPVSKDTLSRLGIMDIKDTDYVTELTIRVTKLIERELKRFGIGFIDIKLEFGRVGGEIAVIDEISGDNMRVEKDGIKIGQMELGEIICR